MDVPVWVWALTIAAILAMLVYDFLFHTRKAHVPSLKEASVWSAVYVGLAVLFGLAVLVFGGATLGSEYFAGYITEKALSVDNLFVFLIIMGSFRVPREDQQKVLLFGIAFALVARTGFIFVGAALINQFAWVFYLFGLILILTAGNMLKGEVSDEDSHEDQNVLIKLARKLIRTSEEYDGDRIFTEVDGKRVLTPMLLVMVALGLTDILFALDSIPAIFGLTQSTFIVFSATAFSLLGLRQLFFLIEGLLERLIYLSYGLAAVLGFIGVKLVLHALHENNVPFINNGEHVEVTEIGTGLSLGVIVGLLVVTVAASLLSRKGRAKTAIGSARRHARDYLDLHYTADDAERERIYAALVEEGEQVRRLGPAYRSMMRDETASDGADRAGAPPPRGGHGRRGGRPGAVSPTGRPALAELTDGPGLAVVRRHRPVSIVQPGTGLPGAPCAAVETDLDGPDQDAVVGLASGSTELRAHRVGGRAWIELTRAGRTTRHESRRHARAPRSSGVALSLTGDLVTALTRDGGRWVARAVLRLDEQHTPGLEAPDVRDEGWLAGLHATGDAARAGTFGQLGLRDPRLVSHADGTPYLLEGALVLSATSAGPGGFGSGHTSLWRLDPGSLDLEHRADLFFRRSERPGVFTDHASHVVRDGDRWLVATSTWGDFDEETRAEVGVTVAVTADDVLRGTHVLDTAPLALPTTGFTSVGTWDPHLVRTAEGWLVAYVSASRFFRFHPVLAGGPTLDALTLRAAATGRTACEGPTLLETADGWRVLASNGRDARRDRVGEPATYPVLDLDLREVGRLAAAYPTNLPWPTLAATEQGWLLVGFDSTPAGGPLLGYGTHGDLVLQLAAEPGPAP